ncbi:MAG: hypothetical protein ACI351_01070 [Candidatus Avelusimicrobium sp.]|uniref:hypothetical protein n=1 Tax=Candidatus Avelusimicrobium sp. TaxID=3048833 RepID=UPI003EFD1016
MTTHTGDIARYQTLGFTRWSHYKLTLFALSVTPEGRNPESGYSISGSNKLGFTLIDLLVVVLIIGTGDSKTMLLPKL